MMKEWWWACSTEIQGLGFSPCKKSFGYPESIPQLSSFPGGPHPAAGSSCCSARQKSKTGGGQARGFPVWAHWLILVHVVLTFCLWYEHPRWVAWHQPCSALQVLGNHVLLPTHDMENNPSGWGWYNSVFLECFVSLPAFCFGNCCCFGVMLVDGIWVKPLVCWNWAFPLMVRLMLVIAKALCASLGHIFCRRFSPFDTCWGLWNPFCSCAYDQQLVMSLGLLENCLQRCWCQSLGSKAAPSSWTALQHLCWGFPALSLLLGLLGEAQPAQVFYNKQRMQLEFFCREKDTVIFHILTGGVVGRGFHFQELQECLVSARMKLQAGLCIVYSSWCNLMRIAAAPLCMNLSLTISVVIISVWSLDDIRYINKYFLFI